jgi:hypothetical protein
MEDNMYSTKTIGMAANLRKAINTADIIRKTNLVLLWIHLMEPNFREKIFISQTSNQHINTVTAINKIVELINPG